MLPLLGGCAKDRFQSPFHARLLLPRKQGDAIGWRRNASVQGNLLRRKFAANASSET
jgi:hypothetical protein